MGSRPSSACGRPGPGGPRPPSLADALRHHGADDTPATLAAALAAGQYRLASATRADKAEAAASHADALASLFNATAPTLDLPRALVRGRYGAAVARMEAVGVPIDVAAFDTVRDRWPEIRRNLAARVERDYRVFDGLTLNARRWAAWLRARGIDWPAGADGSLLLDDDTFRQAARVHPCVAPVWQLKKMLASIKEISIAVGPDGRNRCPLNPFASRTGRNQPSSTKFVFGLPRWLRQLVRPGPGAALGYFDWEQQELGIAAALSGDHVMMDAYASGDFYLQFATLAGAARAGATKESHPDVCERFKAVSLGVLYGQTAAGVGRALNGQVGHGRELLEAHRRLFQKFWAWSDAVENAALATGVQRSFLGW